MRCLIVDDEPLARQGLGKLLLAQPEVEVVGEAADVDTALRRVETDRPDVVFLDVQLRGETGFDLVAKLSRPLPRLIFVTAHDRYAAAAFRVQAVDYLLKPVDPAQLAEALHRMASFTPDSTDSGVIAHPAVLQSLGLSAREAEVLFWLAHGKTNPEIAAILKNSPGTVKKQMQSILTRLGVESRVSAAVIAAERLGMSRPDTPPGVFPNRR